jgi:hypothetical protein
MGSALSGAQIRMYGGGDGTMDTIRGLFTQGFGIGEVLEGLAQSLPEGLRQRFNANGIRGLLGRPYDGSSLKQTYEHLNAMSLTSPNCPSAQELPVMVQNAVSTVAGVGMVDVSVVWDPPWDPSRMSEEARVVLNMF